MSKRNRLVQFAVSNELTGPEGGQAGVMPERVIDSGHLFAWVGIAATLWSVIAISVLVI